MHKLDHSSTVREGAVAPQRSSETIDIMIVDPKEARARSAVDDLKTLLEFRHSSKPTGRAALESYSRARFDAIVCRPDLGDIDCWRFIRMIRSGRFGFGATPIIVLCDKVELEELAPMIDEQTILVLEDDYYGLASTLASTKDGAAKSSVLVVEDEVSAADSAKNALDKYYRVDVAYDGSSGLQLWREKHHSVVLLDLMLPGISGEEVLAAITEENPLQVIIVLTAHDAPATHEALIMAGATDFVSKPLPMHALPELCARALREQSCLRNVNRARAEADQANEVAARIRAANYHFVRGQSGRGSAHLSRALFETRAHKLSDDQWTQLLGDFESK